MQWTTTKLASRLVGSAVCAAAMGFSACGTEERPAREDERTQARALLDAMRLLRGGFDDGQLPAELVPMPYPSTCVTREVTLEGTRIVDRLRFSCTTDSITLSGRIVRDRSRYDVELHATG